MCGRSGSHLRGCRILLTTPALSRDHYHCCHSRSWQQAFTYALRFPWKCGLYPFPDITIDDEKLQQTERIMGQSATQRLAYSFIWLYPPPQWFIFLNERHTPSLHILYALHSTIARALPNLHYLQSIILSYYLINLHSILAVLDPVGQPSWPCSPGSLHMAATPLCPLLFSAWHLSSIPHSSSIVNLSSSSSSSHIRES